MLNTQTETKNVLTLSPDALAVINSYLQLPFANHQVSCPYYNNKRHQMRGALRVLVGKGTPQDIVEEAKIISLRDNVDLTQLNDASLKKFLVDNNLGVECSAFAYYTLNAELKFQANKKLSSVLKFAGLSPMRKLITTFRPAENASVKVFASQCNSVRVEMTKLKPGNMIIMLETGREQTRDHVLLIQEVEHVNNLPTKILYSHAFQWTTDGLYNHGVRTGEIKILNITKPLLEQLWTENGLTNAQNETWLHAKQAKKLDLIKLKAL